MTGNRMTSPSTASMTSANGAAPTNTSPSVIEGSSRVDLMT